LAINFQSISLRPVTSDDDPFLFEVYASSRGEDLATMGWEPEPIRTFLETQYSAQKVFLKNDYPETDDRIIMLGRERIGRIVVLRNDREIRLVDIALMPQYRNAGLGTHLVRDLMSEAAKLSIPFRLQLIRSNPAVALFEQLGLVRTGETGSHYQMEWQAQK
jgi:ribosomal protein S18 acetylase RimI-like enzyme